MESWSYRLQMELELNAMVNFSINEFIKNDEKLDTTFALTNEPLTVIIDLKGYNLDLNLDAVPQIINYKSIIDIPSDEEMTSLLVKKYCNRCFD